MICKSISNTSNHDLQLILEGIDLTGDIILEAQLYPDKLKDKFFAKIFNNAQNWNSIFLDSIAPRRGQS